VNIADNLSKAGWSWGCISPVDSEGRTIWIADAHHGDGKRFIVRADEKLTAFLKLECAAIQECSTNLILSNYRTTANTNDILYVIGVIVLKVLHLF